MRPDTAERRALGEPGAPNDNATTKQLMSADTVTPDAVSADEMAASRCWTWRHHHGCACTTAGDCILATPLPVHAAQPCRGEFGDGGRWRPCCSQEAS